ncbi:hypothetical protein GN958_ATG06222 [Phytophthora infestans]|uniref:Uncharacterized protein n=1 Tax=Phytophthora infestans TaxID=4787 RepID=A0A8S9UXS4_PHYIN|nr:hypothetical protein GN958_ATG06222 [Phytophthora infestans]
MANLHMLYVMLIKLREDLQGSSGHRPCARIPRLSSTPAEAERPFNQNYCNIHPKVFRGAYRINHPELESLFHVRAPYITETMQDMRLRHKFLHLIEVYDITF